MKAICSCTLRDCAQISIKVKDNVAKSLLWSFLYGFECKNAYINF